MSEYHKAEFTKRMNLWVSERQKEEWPALAEELGISVSELVRRCVDNYHNSFTTSETKVSKSIRKKA